MEQENKNIDNNINKEKRKTFQKIDWKFFTTLGTCAVAIALSIAAICKNREPGPAGQIGPAGQVGAAGLNGKSAYEIAKAGGYTGTEEQWIQSLKGENGAAGKTAFEIAVEGGYAGTQVEWLQTLRGLNGKNAYELYVDDCNSSGETPLEQDEWIASLSGANGKSAYELYVEELLSSGETPLQRDQWIDSLKGANGKSAYELYADDCASKGETPLSNEEWVNTLSGGGSANNSLESLEDYFEIFDSLDHYNYDYRTIGDPPYYYYLENAEDVDTIYNGVTDKRIVLKGSAVDYPVTVSGYNQYNYGTETDPDWEPIDLLLTTAITEDAKFDINVKGEGEDRYVALHMDVFRTYATKEETTYFECYEENLLNPLDDIKLILKSDAEFTKIDGKYYMIFSCESFGLNYIQEFSEELYKHTVASIIYGVDNILFTSGKDYFANMPGFNFYQENFIGTKTENSASVKYSNVYTSEITFIDDKIVGSKTHFDDFMGISSSFRGTGEEFAEACAFEQEVSVLYKDCGHAYRTALPTDGAWEEAGNYTWIGGDVDLIDSLVDHLDLYSSIVYQIVEIINCGYIGIPMVM